MQMTPWSDTNRYSQEGYSSPTVWPIAGNYTDIQLWAFDYASALRREQSHQEWLEEESLEYRQEWAEYCAEVRAEREEQCHQ